jgi:hypothetical protein
MIAVVLSSAFRPALSSGTGGQRGDAADIIALAVLWRLR